MSYRWVIYSLDPKRYPRVVVRQAPGQMIEICPCRSGAGFITDEREA